MRKKPELLAPAGDMEKLRMAVLYGADAVYLAGTSFGMRSFAGNFTADELPEAVRFAHDHGVRVHVTVNTMPRNDEVARLPEHLERLNDLGVDALILADLGAFTLAGRYAPRCERHISTQQSIANYECARAWYDLGAKRVVLAREVSLQEIREMRAKLPPELELETFCHGAMCVSYSGRCLLSNYMTGRDSNRGACAQPCRYQYALMEEKRPGEYFPVFEDEKGTYIMNSRDMCMIGHLDDIMDAGIDCIKIEGRAKSEYYAAIVTGAYRHVLDEVAAGRRPTRSGSTRSSTSVTATIRPAFITVSRGSITTIPATSATGRSWRWSRAATRTAWRRSACAISSARATRWRSWGRTASRSPWSFPRCATPRASRCSSREIPA